MANLNQVISRGAHHVGVHEIQGWHANVQRLHQLIQPRHVSLTSVSSTQLKGCPNTQATIHGMELNGTHSSGIHFVLPNGYTHWEKHLITSYANLCIWCNGVAGAPLDDEWRWSMAVLVGCQRYPTETPRSADGFWAKSTGRGCHFQDLSAFLGLDKPTK